CHHQSAFARCILGNVLLAKNKHVEAERLYLESYDILVSLGDDRSERELLTHCLTGLGNLTNDPARRKEYYRRPDKLSEILHKDDPDNWYYRNQLGQSLYNFAHNRLFADRTTEAEPSFQRCTALLEPLVEGSSRTTDPSSERVVSQNILFHCY